MKISLAIDYFINDAKIKWETKSKVQSNGFVLWALFQFCVIVFKIVLCFFFFRALSFEATGPSWRPQLEHLSGELSEACRCFPRQKTSLEFFLSL